MFPVSGLPPTAAPARSRRPAATGSGFALPPDTPAAASSADAVGHVALPGMLALQEADEAGRVTDREARQHGHELLNALAALQRSLLSGPPDPSTLRNLATLTTKIPPAADPDLRACLAQCSLRARIELVRYGFE